MQRCHGEGENEIWTFLVDFVGKWPDTRLGF